MRHPYAGIADYRRWDRGVAQVPAQQVDPVVAFPIRIDRQQAIVTAGSCFAQHIARYLRQEGFNYLVTEPGHPVLGDKLNERYGYGLFSARYGNIYTSRQLVQLLDRAYGELHPADSSWEGEGGTWIDPFRPTMQPGGYATLQELEADRAQHLAAVRRAFEQLDVFIFTLGLTECWAARADGCVFPIAPGVAGGTFDPDRYVFANLGVDETVADMERFIAGLRRVNPGAQVILTVSPVPLNATALDRHVLVSTAHSKAVLRVAAGMLAETLPGVHYFPSYEIVTGGFSRGAYFETDLRSVTEEGVAHVMSLFFEHATTGAAGPRPEPPPEAPPVSEKGRKRREIEAALALLCDEELLTLEAD